jgi:hypothetical protein
MCAQFARVESLEQLIVIGAGSATIVIGPPVSNLCAYRSILLGDLHFATGTVTCDFSTVRAVQARTSRICVKAELGSSTGASGAQVHHRHWPCRWLVGLLQLLSAILMK